MAGEDKVITCHTKDQFDLNLAKGKKECKLVVIDFTASWCGPCRFMEPVFAELAKKYPSVLFLKVDFDELQDVATTWGIQSIPTFIFLKEGEKVFELCGAQKEELISAMEEHAGSSAGTASASA